MFGKPNGQSRTVAQKNVNGFNLAIDQLIVDLQLHIDKPSELHPFIKLHNTTGPPLSAWEAPGSHANVTARDEAAVITEYLEARTRAVKITGRADIGKTTLAVTVTSRLPIQATYYLDFAFLSLPLGLADQQILQERLSHLDQPESAVILDNVHRDPDTERMLVSYWRQKDRQARFLVISRHSDQHQILPVVPLKVTPQSLAAVWLAVRRDTITDLPDPPSEVYEAWATIFPNLTVFSLAVRNQIGRLKKGLWNLSLSHAHDYVRERYVQARDGCELDGLRLLVAASIWESSVSQQSLPSGSMKRFIAEGIVYCDNGRYQLPHPTTADLLQQVMSLADLLEPLRTISASDPVTGFEIALAMTRSSSAGDSTRLFKSLTNDDSSLRKDIVVNLQLPEIAKMTYELLTRKLVDAARVDVQLSEFPGSFQKKIEWTSLPNILQIQIYLRRLPAVQRLIKAYLADSQVQAQFLEWGHDAPLAELMFSIDLTRNQGHTNLARQLVELLRLTRTVEMDSLIIDANVSTINSLLKASQFVRAMFEHIATVIAKNLSTVVSNLYTRGLDEFCAYDKLLVARWPDVATAFRLASMDPAQAISFKACLNRANIGSLARMLAGANERVASPYPDEFISKIRDELCRRLAPPALLPELLNLHHNDLAGLLAIGKVDDAVGATMSAVYNSIKENAADIGLIYLDSGLDAFVHVGDLLDLYCLDAAEAWRSVTLDPQHADKFSRAISSASVYICTQFQLWLYEIATELPAEVAAALNRKQALPPLAASAQTKNLVGSVCLRADRLFRDRDSSLRWVIAGLELFDPTVPAIAGRLLAIAAISKEDFWEKIATVERLPFRDRYSALVALTRITQSDPDLESEAWRRLITEIPADQKLHRMILLASASRITSVARAVTDTDDVRDFESVCEQYVVDWYGRSVISTTKYHIRGWLHAYVRATNDDDLNPRLLPYQIVSLIHFLRFFPPRDTGLEEKVSMRLVRQLCTMAGPLNFGRFRQWGKYSDFALAVVANAEQSP